MNKKGQVAIFIIIAIAIVGLIVGFVLFREKIGLVSVPAEVEPVFSYYDSCIEQALEVGVSVAGQQGGWVEPGAYEPGNDYNPFSSHLFYSGNQIPYWFSLSGNNVVKERVPSMTQVQDGLAKFVADNLRACDFSALRAQGYSINSADPKVSVKVEGTRVVAQVSAQVSASKAGVSAVKSVHNVEIASPFGSLYNQALTLYSQEKDDAFLEQYSVDVLRLYAPVDGVLVQCAPNIWSSQQVADNISSALEANLGEIRFGDPASVKDADVKYFTVKSSVNANTRVVYTPSWPRFLDISPASQESMIAEPVGNQPGLGVMGFCYVPYHFIYNVRFPVLFQLSENNFVFQFPVVVVIDKNVARQSLSSTGPLGPGDSSDICSFKEGNVRVSTYSSDLSPVAANVAYQCFEQRCDLGKTKIVNGQAVLDAAIPLCSNGYLIASADNYSETRQLFSSNKENIADLLLEKEYPVKVDVKMDGVSIKDTAVVHFATADGSISALLPGAPNIKLKEGLYNVSVFVYGSSSLTIPGTTKQQCVSSAQGGLFGFFGSTKEECFAVKTPDTKIDSALRGGGSSSDVYLLPSELQGGKLVIYVSSLPAPNSLQQLQTNFELFSSANVEVGTQ